MYDEIDLADLQIHLELLRGKRSVRNFSDAVGILKFMEPELRG